MSGYGRVLAWACGVDLDGGGLEEDWSGGEGGGAISWANMMLFVFSHVPSIRQPSEPSQKNNNIILF